MVNYVSIPYSNNQPFGLKSRIFCNCPIYKSVIVNRKEMPKKNKITNVQYKRVQIVFLYIILKFSIQLAHLYYWKVNQQIFLNSP